MAVDPAAVIGHRYPAGTYTISAWEDRILRDSLGAPASRDGEAHPIWGYLAAQGGLGTDIEGLLEPVDARTADGTMIVSCAIDYARDLRIGVTYTSTGQIDGLERKRGRRTGPFDLFTFHVDMAEPDGTHAARLAAAWVLPRNEEAGDGA